MTNVPRLILATVLLAGAYAVVGAVILLDLAIVASPILLYVVRPGAFPLPGLSGSLAAISATSIVAMGSGIAVARRHTAEPWASVEIPPRDAEDLTAMIDDIAARSKATAVPAELRLTVAANAGVSEGQRAFGIGKRDSRLYLGLPVLAGMTRIQLKAVLSHEIGHYAGRHSRFGIVVHRGSLSLGTVCAVLRMLLASSPQQTYPGLRFAARIAWLVLMVYVGIDYAIISAYAALYNRLCYSIRRRQEYEADAMAARIVGGAELAGALGRIHALSSAWDDFQGRYLKPMREVGCVPDNPFEAFRSMIEDADYQDVLRGWEESPPDNQPSPTDTHPCLAHRIARLNAMMDADRRPGDHDAADREAAVTILPVLADRPWIPELWAAELAPGEQLESLPWDECVNRVGQRHAAAAASELLSAVGGAPSVADVLDLVIAGRGDLAALIAEQSTAPAAARAAVRAAAPAEDPLAQLSRALLALFGHMMVATGRVRWQVAWRAGGGPPRLASYDVSDAGIEQFGDRVASFVAVPDSVNAGAIVLQLLGLGIDPGLPVTLDSAGTPGSAAGTGAAGTPTAAKLVIRPRTNELEAESKGLVRVVGIPLALTATIVSIALTVHHNDATAAPPPPDFTYSPYAPPAPTLRPFTLPTTPVLLPTTPVLLPSLPVSFPSLGVGCADGFLTDCETVTVRSGDTLSLLACQHRTTVPVLRSINDLAGSTVIKVGERLYVPVPAGGPAVCS